MRRFSPDGLFFLIVVASVSGAAFLLPSAVDDFWTTRPLFSLGFNDLLVHGPLWRPFETLYLRSLGTFAELHDVYAHTVTLVGHFLSVWMLLVLLRNYTALSERTRLLLVLAFACHPGAIMAVWSLDSAVQTYSTFWGLAALLAYLRGSRFTFLIFALFAVLSKESGASWFVLPPFIAALRDELKFDEALKAESVIDRAAQRTLWTKLFVDVMLGLLVFGGYWLLRQSLTAPDAFVAMDGSYQLAFTSPSQWLKNFASLGGVAATTIDTVAVFAEPRSPFLAGFTLALSLPALFSLSALFLALPRTALFFVLAVFVVVAGPHLPMGQVSEMYAYPLVAVLALVAGIATDHHWRRREKSSVVSGFLRRAPWIIGICFLGMFITDVHKGLAAFETGDIAKDVALAASTALGGTPPETLCVLEQETSGGYSGWKQGPIQASAFGLSVETTTAWRLPKIFSLVSKPEKCHFEVLLEVLPDGKVVVHRSPFGQNAQETPATP